MLARKHNTEPSTCHNYIIYIIYVCYVCLDWTIIIALNYGQSTVRFMDDNFDRVEGLYWSL